MATVKECYKCKHFRNILHVHPKSIFATRESKQPGWYIKCIDYVLVSEAISPGDDLAIDFKFLKYFMRVNSQKQVECPMQKQIQRKTENRYSQVILFV